MTDRELLELAAKAAGYVIEINYYGMDRHGLFNPRIRGGVSRPA